MQMWVCLWSNVISVLLSLGGIAYLSWLLATSWSSEDVCGEQLFDDPSAWGHCVRNLRLLNVRLSVDEPPHSSVAH